MEQIVEAACAEAEVYSNCNVVCFAFCFFIIFSYCYYLF